MPHYEMWHESSYSIKNMIYFLFKLIQFFHALSPEPPKFIVYGWVHFLTALIEWIRHIKKPQDCIVAHETFWMILNDYR